jgi:hypothetical protein
MRPRSLPSRRSRSTSFDEAMLNAAEVWLSMRLRGRDRWWMPRSSARAQTGADALRSSTPDAPGHRDAASACSSCDGSKVSRLLAAALIGRANSSRLQHLAPGRESGVRHSLLHGLVLTSGQQDQPISSCCRELDGGTPALGLSQPVRASCGAPSSCEQNHRDVWKARWFISDLPGAEVVADGSIHAPPCCCRERDRQG